MPHTPAPWLICDATEFKHIGYRAIVTVDGETICTPSPMGNADAALIAAAPDLLAVLMDFVSHYGSDDVSRWMEIRETARAAIARATA